MAAIAGIDIGGTFTDVLLYDEAEKSLRLAKVLSTTELQSRGVMSGLRQVEVPLRALSALLHGTTVATNAVLERKGARTALITTRGFKDVLELRRRDRPTTYGLTGSYVPLVPRSRSLEVDERISYDGQVVEPLSPSSVEHVIARVKELEVESVAICLMNSYVNPTHEQQLAAALEEALPHIPISASVVVAPEAGEFERASTTAVNAYVRKQMSAYLDDVQTQLANDGFDRDFLVMQSNGGVAPAKVAGADAARTVLSGPAAGTVAAATFGRAAGLPDVISCDMGGTSFDAALIPNGQPAVTRESSIEYGVPLKLPMIDIKTIGAGGGSIASVDRAGILQVGPESAGSSPGPACYGRGGTRPTVSDANMVLGRISEQNTLGTQEDFVLDRDAAVRAVREHVAVPLELDVEAAALAIVRIANEKMANAIRMVSVDKGYDPRKFALVGFGGAGPLHIAELARAIGSESAIIPPHPGALSAFGCLLGDIKYDYVTSVGGNVDDADPILIEEYLTDHRTRGTEAVLAEGFDESQVSIEHVAELSFTKQLYSLDVPLGTREHGWSGQELAALFQDAYAATFGGRRRDADVALVSLHTIVTGVRPPIEVAPVEPRGAAQVGNRRIVFDDGAQDVPVLRRDALEPAQVIAGPAVINQTDTTTLLPPRSVATVMDNGSLVVRVEA